MQPLTRVPAVRALVTLTLNACAPPALQPGEVLPFPDEIPVTHAPDNEPEAERRIEALVVPFMEDQGPPGLSLAVVRDGAVIYSGAYGWADIATGRPLDPHTPLLLSSITKTLLGVTAMQGVEAGRLSLDDAVSDMVGFSVDHTDTPIRLRHLLTHHSGIRDTRAYSTAYANGDPTVSLENFLSSYLQEDGSRWSTRNVASHAPGKRFAYSNVGAALAGLALGQRAGLPYNDLVRRDVLEPLGMEDSAFFLDDLETLPAVPYARERSGFAPYAQYGYPTYPDGMLRTSAHDIGRYTAAMANQGSLDGASILTPASTERMLEVDPTLGTDEDGQAIAWAMRELDGRPLIGHNGTDYGSFCELWFDPETGSGFAILLNGVPGSSFQNAIQLEIDLMAVADGT